MTNLATADITKILVEYQQLGEKKLFKDALKDINTNKKIWIFYSKKRDVPICTIPKLRLILSSRNGFLAFCFNFFTFINYHSNLIPISTSNIKCIANTVIAHEVGHILDPDIQKAKEEYVFILSSLIDKLVEYDIDLKDINIHKKNLPYDLEDCVRNLKRNLIARETKAWDIAKEIITFENANERFLFDKVKEYALATYNFGNLKTIIKEHNLDTFLKYRKYLE